jgi:starvation-inducible DNA-binding protein
VEIVRVLPHGHVLARSAPRATSRSTPCCRAGRRNAGARAPGQLLAERVTALGGIAEGTLEAAAGHSALPSYPVEIVPEREHVDALSTALAVFGKAAREAIEEAARFGDADTADVFTEISRETDKQLWLVESHLHG